MRRPLIILLLTCACTNMQAQVKIITTICGNNIAGYSGDGGFAKDAELNVPYDVCFDKSSNIYISDAFNNRIRKIAVGTGVINTIAGTGSVGFSGDGTLATNAELFIPDGIFTDTANNIYIADAGNNRIRKITAATGIITTVAGSGATGISVTGSGGDGAQATNAELSNPSGLCLDKHGNIFIADYGNNKIRKVDALTGIITTVAGKGTNHYMGTGFVEYSGDGGQATDAGFSGTIQVFVDNDDNIFICDQYNNAIRKVDPSTGIIATIAGKGSVGYSGDNGLATDAKLNQPSGVFVNDNKDVFIAEYRNGTIRKINGATGIITTVAGTGVFGFLGDGEPATNAQLRCANLREDKYGTLFVADVDNNRIRMVYDTSLHNVGVKQVGKMEMKIYPNPASDELIIEGAEGVAVSVWNMHGQSIYNRSITKNNETINVSSLTPGLYFIQLVSFSGGKEIRRFIKQ